MLKYLNLSYKTFLLLAINLISALNKDDDPLSYKEIDVDQLNDQWNDEEEKLDEELLPPTTTETPPIPLNDNDEIGNQEKMKDHLKSAKTKMVFVNLNGNDDIKLTEKLGDEWAAELFRSNLSVKMFVPEANKLIYVLLGGFDTMLVKDHLLTKEEVIDVTVNKQTFSTKTLDKSEL
ncbi:hypothetical protein SNEBB_009752 [Seison nebaliae]|nr:hypothetical protein SNEBB_009752 [Seison nebaliae]